MMKKEQNRARRLVKSRGLTDLQLAHIDQLEDECNQFDGLQMKLNWNRLRNRPGNQINDFLLYEGNNLIGYLTLYIFTSRAVEISAMTHPEYRRRGIFTQLLGEARLELANRLIPDVLFICEQASEAGRQCMKAIGARYEFTEYKMNLREAVKATKNPVLQLRPARLEDIADLARMDEICFEVPFDKTQQHLERDLIAPNQIILLATVGAEKVGKIQVLMVNSETFIYAFCVLPEHRKKGYGRSMLSHTVKQLVAENCRNIWLEVESNNRHALALYKQCGFQVTTAYDYYRLPISD